MPLLAAAWLFPGLIAAVVFNNQIGSDLRLLGPVLNALNVAAACAIVAYASDRLLPIVGYTAALVAFFAASKSIGIRAPYETALNVLFLFAGAIAASQHMELIRKIFVVVALVGAVVMVIQLVGVGEGAQPTLFVPWNELRAEQTQTRPAGLTHSTQFSSLLVLVAVALWLAHGRSIAVTAALSAAAVVGLAKVAILGVMTIAVVMLFVPRQRCVALAALVGVPACVAVYYVLFPGVMDIFFLSGQTIAVTLMVRVADVAHFSFGYDYAQIILAINSFSELSGLPVFSDAARIIDPVAAAKLSITTVGESSTGILRVLYYGRPIGGALAIVILYLAIHRPAYDATKAWFRARTDATTISMTLALAWFCVAADFINSQILWGLIGIAAANALPSVVMRHH